MEPQKQGQDDINFALLQQLERAGSGSQRELAERLGVSVGKLNYCLRAAIERGWVKVSNFQRSDNKLAYAYLLTPSGAAAKLRLTRAFLAQKEREFEFLRRQIDDLRKSVEQGGQGQVM